MGPELYIMVALPTLPYTWNCSVMTVPTLLYGPGTVQCDSCTSTAYGPGTVQCDGFTYTALWTWNCTV